MTAIADDFDGIAGRLRSMQTPATERCLECENRGWVGYYPWPGGDPGWEECPICRNPEDLPCP